MVYTLTAPLSLNDRQKLRAGDQVLLSGTILTARDAAHQRLTELIAQNKKLPITLKDAIIYYVGPTPAPEGLPIGSAGPTTSDRMDPFTPLMLEHGVQAVIGKGQRTKPVNTALEKHQAIYFGALGGAGALLATHIKAAKIIAFPELGTEAIHELVIENFPVVVLHDIIGGDLYGDRT